MESEKKLWKSIVIGCAAGLAVIVGLCLIGTALIGQEKLPLNSAGILGIAVLVIGIFFACRIAARLQGGKMLLTSGITLIAVLGTIILCRAAMYPHWSERTLAGILTGTAAAAAAALLPTGRRARRRRH